MTVDLTKLTTERIAAILYEEFDRDGWGDIDPDLLAMIADGNNDPDDDNYHEAEALAKVLDRIIKRLRYDE